MTKLEELEKVAYDEECRPRGFSSVSFREYQKAWDALPALLGVAKAAEKVVRMQISDGYPCPTSHNIGVRAGLDRAREVLKPALAPLLEEKEADGE